MLRNMRVFNAAAKVRLWHRPRWCGSCSLRPRPSLPRKLRDMHVRMVRTITALPHKLSSFDFVPQILEVRTLSCE
jgi:hypothetical protein